MRYLLTALLALALTACSTSLGVQAGGLKVALQSSVVDPRVGQKNIALGAEAVTVDVYKDPVSEQAAEAAKELVPELAAAVIRGLIAHGALSALGEAASDGGALDDLLNEAPDEVLPDSGPETE